LDQTSYRCGDFLIESANRRFSHRGVEVVLEPKVFAVVLQLLAQPGDLVTRDQLLDAVWGHRFVTPSTLNRVITLARRAFADGAEEQKFIQTVHRAGYRYVGPIEREPIGVAHEIQARFAPPPSARAPAPLETLIGREGELSQMQALLADGRALTVVGTGGMGKTQCALAFSHQRSQDYPDGVWFFDLVPLHRADEWLEALALALSMPPTGERELLDRVTQALLDRRALLVLDNCDRLSVGVGEILVELLRGTNHLKVLATSQQQLSFVGERVLRMPPLGLPALRQPAAEQELREIAAAPAVALLLTRVRSVQPGFSLSASNASAVVEICERLDGMPLALELAAARFALLSPQQVLERLAHRFRFLLSEAAGRDKRHRNLATLLEWSFGLLSSDEKQFLAWLSVFVQGWTVDAALDLAPALGRDPESVVDLLTGLADKSLVAVDQSATPPRYRLLETVREFAMTQVCSSGEEQRARDAHLAYVRRMADLAHQDMIGGRMRERIASLIHEHGNIESACDYALGAGNDPQAALQITGSLFLYFKAHGNGILGLRLCGRALSVAPRSRTRERCLALMCLGVNGMMLNNLLPNEALADAASIARETGDEWLEAYASGYFAMWLSNTGRATEAEEHLAIIEQVAEQLDDAILRGLAGLASGWMYLALGAIDRAIAVLQVVRHLGSDFHQHHFIDIYIAFALFRRGDFAAAAIQFHESMRNALTMGNIRGAAGSIEGCGYIAERMGQLEQACRCLGAADQIRKRTGIPLYNFWIPPNEHAHVALRSALGPVEYAAAIDAGVRLREEDAANEAAALLRHYGTGAAVNYRTATPR
jgi:predicted ATPase/DNA-binding winged helix-turn-helix (wHTH) protein